jgi:hypothetical protein
MTVMTRENCAIPGDTLPRVEISEVTIHAMHAPSNAVQIQVDMNLNHRVGNPGLASWFEDDNMKRFLRLRVIQSRHEDVSRFISGGMKTIVDSGALETLSIHSGSLVSPMSEPTPSDDDVRLLLKGWLDYGSSADQDTADLLIQRVIRDQAALTDQQPRGLPYLRFLNDKYILGYRATRQFKILWEIFKPSSVVSEGTEYKMFGIEGEDTEGYLTIYDVSLAASGQISNISENTDNDGHQTVQAQLKSVMFGKPDTTGDQVLTSEMIEGHLSYYAYLYVDFDALVEDIS